MKKILISSAILVLFCAQNVLAQLPNAQKALFHTQTGKVLSKGQLDIYTNMNFYSKIGDFIGGVQPGNFYAVNYWLVASNVVFTYGIMDHLEEIRGRIRIEELVGSVRPLFKKYSLWLSPNASS